MTADSDGIHAVANTERQSLAADVVFVHGLGGSSHSTWRHGKEGDSDHFFWPEELAKDLPSCGIWTVGYPAGITEFGNPGMTIAKRAGNLSQKLANEDLGQRPLLFVTHSMGGLVVKSLLVDSQALPDSDRKRLAGAVRGIVFCATPHRGSEFANAARVLGKFFGGSQSHVDEMQANSDQLDLLHDQFVEWQRHHPFLIQSYAENIGLFRKRWWWRQLQLRCVVPRASANPSIAGHVVHDVDDDHLTIVKPRSRDHDVYAGVRRFIETIIGPHPDSSPTARPNEPLFNRPCSNGVDTANRPHQESTAEQHEAVMTRTATAALEELPPMPRDIVYRFYQLSWLTRLRIAIDLGLYNGENDADANEAELARRVFVRAREQEKLAALEAAIDEGLAESRE